MNNYYVYMLVNPFTNKPFYVGKGQILDYCRRKYRRLSDHLKLIDTQNKYKVNMIKKIRRMGGEPIVEIYKDKIFI